MRTDIIEYLQKEVYHRCKQPTNKFGMKRNYFKTFQDMTKIFNRQYIKWQNLE